MNRIIIFIAMFLSLCGCVEKYQPEDMPQIVVEGWIEDGGFPIVMLTTTVSVAEEKTQWDDLKENIIRWAKVSVSDGEREEVLTGRKNNDYFPPYVYTSSRMRGEAGKTYTLKVEYSGRTVTASTSVPYPVALEWIKTGPSEKEGQVSIVAGLKDNPDTKDYYKFFTKVMHEDSVYVSSFMGLVDDALLGDGVNEIVVQRGSPIKFGSDDLSVTFQKGSDVMVKLCTMDEVSYNYWEDYEDISFLSKNPFFPVTRKIRSNIEGGLGYWAGYGSSIYRMSIPL
jgi:hypothetical protein